jgi:hypothetical protein
MATKHPVHVTSSAVVKTGSRGRWLKTKLHSLSRKSLGESLLSAVGLAVLVVGGLSGFGLLTGKKWGATWLLLFTAERVGAKYLSGDKVREFSDSIERVNSAIAGTIDDYSAFLKSSHDGKLGESQAHSLVCKLLARVTELTALAYQLGPSARVRATFAVPHVKGGVSGVRVWCYDQPYQNRRWSFFAYGTEGAAAAYKSGAIQVIKDVNELLSEGNTNGGRREYRSVASVPVFNGGPNGTKLGVINVDIPVADFFTAESILQQLRPLIAPAANLIGLFLVNIRQGERYEFQR